MLTQINQKVPFASKMINAQNTIPAFRSDQGTAQHSQAPSGQVVLPKNFTAAELAGMVQSMNSTKTQSTQVLEQPKLNNFTQVSAKHILVDSSELALTIKDSIESGKLTFEEAAQQFSSCPSGRNGGDLGFFDRNSMVKPFSDAAFNAKINEIVGPIETKFGFHLIKVTDKK